MNIKPSLKLWLLITGAISIFLIGVIIIGLTNINTRANKSISDIQSNITLAKEIQVETESFDKELTTYLNQKSSPLWLLSGNSNQQKLANLNTRIQDQINIKNTQYLDLQVDQLADYIEFLSLNPSFEAGDSISQISATLESAKAQNPITTEQVIILKNELKPQFESLKQAQDTLVEKIKADNQKEILRVLAEQKIQDEAQALQQEKIRIAELVKKEKALEAKKAKEVELKKVQEEESKRQKYIYINLTNQTMQAFEYGKEVYKTSVTTGRTKSPTVTGTYAIYYKETGRYLSGWDDVEKHTYKVWVDYWMPFYEGYGIHDADWRKSFGGEDYKTTGSNGCVNTPNEAIEFFWNFGQVGTKVVVE